MFAWSGRRRAPKTTYEGMRVIRARDAMVFLYADEIPLKLMNTRIDGFYAVDKVKSCILAGESSRTLRLGNALVFMERTAYERELGRRPPGSSVSSLAALPVS